MLDLVDLCERAKEIGGKAAKKAYDTAYRDALERLYRAKPIIDILESHKISVFIDKMPETPKGICITIEGAESAFVYWIELIAGEYLHNGTILFPSNFDKYTERMEAVTQCKEILAMHQIASEIITKEENGLAVLYVPPTVL